MEENNKQPKNSFHLIMGILFIAFGGFRLYQQFNTSSEINTFRLILAIAFVGYGGFRVYTYLNTKE